MLTDNNRGPGIAAVFQESRQAGIQPSLEFRLIAVTLPAVRLEDRTNIGLERKFRRRQLRGDRCDQYRQQSDLKRARHGGAQAGSSGGQYS